MPTLVVYVHMVREDRYLVESGTCYNIDITCPWWKKKTKSFWSLQFWDGKLLRAAGLYIETECDNSFHTEAVFSHQNINVVCLSDFLKFCKFCQNFEWRKDHSELYGLGQQLSSASSGHLVPRACQGKLLTQSSFGVEWVKTFVVATCEN